MEILAEDILKLVGAVLVGAVIGAEREFRDKSAGFRTLIFICVGATLFTMFSIKVGGDDDRVRIAANIVSGVGFLGAGAILRDGSRVTGLTTASMIWLAAALGMGIGGGHFLISLSALAIIVVVLWGFPLIEGRIDKIRDTRTYELVCPVDTTDLVELDHLFLNSGLQIFSRKRTKTGGDMVCVWVTNGSPTQHEQLEEKLFHMQTIKELRT